MCFPEKKIVSEEAVISYLVFQNELNGTRSQSKAFIIAKLE